jgi:hypothetical protein
MPIKLARLGSNEDPIYIASIEMHATLIKLD